MVHTINYRVQAWSTPTNSTIVKWKFLTISRRVTHYYVVENLNKHSEHSVPNFLKKSFKMATKSPTNISSLLVEDYSYWVINTHETCLQECIVILKHLLENYNKFLKTCFMGCSWFKSNISYEETCFQDFLTILKRITRQYWRNVSSLLLLACSKCNQ